MHIIGSLHLPHDLLLTVFSVERWYKIMQPAFERARQKMEREEAR